MTHDSDRRLELRLAPANGQPADPQVLDDLIRLIRQGIATAPKEYPKVGDGQFRLPSDEERRAVTDLEGKIKHDVEQASADSEADVARRAEVAALPDADQKLADEARKAAELVVAAVQRALLRGVRAEVPADDPPPAASP